MDGGRFSVVCNNEAISKVHVTYLFIALILANHVVLGTLFYIDVSTAVSFSKSNDLVEDYKELTKNLRLFVCLYLDYSISALFIFILHQETFQLCPKILYNS